MMTYTQLSNQEPYLIIHADGRITASEKLQPSETAARVLECIKTQWMEDSQSKQIRELQDRIQRLEKALERLFNLPNDCCCQLSNSSLDAWNNAHEALKAMEAKP